MPQFFGARVRCRSEAIARLGSVALLVTSVAALAECPPLLVLEAPAPAMSYGGVVAMAPDPDPLRRGIIVIGAPDTDQDAAASPKGRAYVHRLDGGLLFPLFGEDYGDEFAQRIAVVQTSAGIVIVAGAPGRDLPAGVDCGVVYFFGGLDGAPLGHREGTQSGGRFGGAMVAAGDANGDGEPDMIVAAPKAGPAGGGQVVVLSGVAPFPTIAGPFNAAAGQSMFGATLADAGAAPGGGRRIAIGAKEMGTGAGVVVIIDSSTGAVVRTLTGETPTERFGAALACADFDGDSVREIVVGSPDFSPPGLALAGRVSVFSGATGVRLRHSEGDEVADHLGFALAVVGDLDGDSIADFAVGAPGAHLGRIITGVMDQISGADGHRIRRFHGPGDINLWPTALAGHPALDWNTDARPDIAVGAPLATVGGVTRGIVSIYAGGVSAADLNADGVVNSSDLGLLLGAWGACAAPPPALCPGDANRDGLVGSTDLSLILGAWGGCS